MKSLFLGERIRNQFLGREIRLEIEEHYSFVINHEELIF